MYCIFKGGPLDGLQRDIEDRALDLVYLAHCYEAKLPQTDITRYPPDYPEAWRLGYVARYVGRKWLDSEGVTICVEYTHERDDLPGERSEDR